MQNKLKAYLTLAKIQITRTVVITSGIGYYIAWQTSKKKQLPENLFGFNLEENFATDFEATAVSAAFNVTHFFLTLFAIALVCAASCAFNHALETTSDAKMGRTKNRPILSGAVSSRETIIFGAIIGCIGLAILSAITSLIIAVCALATLALYDLVYTPLKQRTPWNTTVGAIPGALPIVGGYVAFKNSSGDWLTPLILFLILFIWQHPHFYAIAWIYRKDYSNAGYKMITAKDKTGRLTFGISIALIFLLGVFCWALTLPLSSLNWMYNTIMFAMCTWFALITWKALLKPNTKNARAVVLISVLFFPVWFIAIAVDFLI